MQPLITPVLLLVFNRPEKTRRVMEVLRSARPEKLYIAADGPRRDVPGEEELCRQARREAENVDWPCEVQTLFQEANLGCKQGVSTGITWFFDQEPEGIILEDDVLPEPGFFQFCGELLERYRDEERIMSISGLNSYPEPLKTEKSYVFSRYSLMWGWATWRTAWEKYDLQMTRWPELRKTDWLRTVGDGRYLFQKQWEKVFDECYRGEIDTWDFQWIYSCWVHGGLSVLPAVNLVRNIGFGPDATHTVVEDDRRKSLESRELAFPLCHPEQIRRSPFIDRYLDKHWFEVEWIRQIKRSLLNVSWIRSVWNLRHKI